MSLSYSRIKTNQILAKILQNEKSIKPNSKSSLILHNKKKQNKTVMDSSFNYLIQRPLQKNNVLDTSYSSQNNNFYTRVQTEPPVSICDYSYLNPEIKERTATQCDSRDNKPQYIEKTRKNKRKFASIHSFNRSISHENSLSFHKRSKTLLSNPNNSTLNSKNIASKFDATMNNSNNINIECILQEFMRKNIENEKLSVVQYLERFFCLLDFLQESNGIYGLIKEIILLPFQRISFQFENIKALYKEKLVKIDQLFKESEKNRVFRNEMLEENKVLKQKLLHYEDLLEKTKQERDIFMNQLQRSNIENALITRDHSTDIERNIPNNQEIVNVGKRKFAKSLKDQLKLNLDVIKKITFDGKNQIYASKFEENDNNNNNNKIIDFHDEFMSKFDEFSISWKNQALQENKHL